MNLKDKLKELKPHDLNCNIFDVYSYNGLSMQDLLCQFFSKINECIGVSNDTLELSSWLVNEGLKNEVAEKLVLWYEDGTLENLINVTLFENLNNKIDVNKKELDENISKALNKIDKIKNQGHTFVEDFKTINNTWDDAIKEALDVCDGGTIIFPKAQTIVLNESFTINPNNFLTSITLNLNSCIIEYNGDDILFKLTSNMWQNWIVNKKISIVGDGATIKGNIEAKGCIEMVDSLNYKVCDLNINNFPTGFGIQIRTRDDLNHWAEENIVENINCVSCLISYRTKMTVSNLGTHSMNHTVFLNCKANLKLNNAIGFYLEGNHARTIIDSCGGWVQEDGANNTCMFVLNGWFEGAYMVNPWVDTQTSFTHENCIRLMEGYVQGGGHGDKYQQITISNVGTPNYFKLDNELYKYVKVQSINKKYGRINCAMLNEPQYFTNNDQQIGTFYASVLINPQDNTTVERATVNMFGTRFSELLHINVQARPLIPNAHDDFNKIGKYGFSKVLTDDVGICGFEVWGKGEFPYGQYLLFIKAEGILASE